MKIATGEIEEKADAEPVKNARLYFVKYILPKQFGPAVQRFGQHLDGFIDGVARQEMLDSMETRKQQGVPQELAVRSARLRSVVHVLDISEISMQTGLELGAVGAVYRDLGERLKIDWLRDQIESLPWQGNWQERARIDAGDELAALHAALTAQVLKAATEPGECLVDRRSGPFRDALKRYHHLLDEIGNADRCDLAMVTVALGELRALARCNFANAAHGSL